MTTIAHHVLGKVCLDRTVASEAAVFAAGIGRSAKPGVYPFTMNPQGAVCAVLPNGDVLGLKPGEFAFVEITEPLTPRQVGAWLELGVELRALQLAPVLERVRTELAFAEAKRYLAVPIDIADIKALLAAVGGES